MRNYNRRVLSLLLALSLVSPLLTSCSDTPAEESPSNPDAFQTQTPTAETDSEVVVEEEAEITRENTPDTLPGDLNYNGTTFTIYYSNGFGWTDQIEGGEEMTGEVVSDSAMLCNQSVAERLNLDLAYYAENTGDWSTINALVSNLIMANDSTYDVYLGEQYGLTQTAVKGYYLNAFDLPYFNFEQPWWNTTFMENLQLLPDNRVFLTGDFSLTTLCSLAVQYFNKTIYNNLYGDPDGLYQTVLEGKWTLDKMTELISGAYIDLHGNGTADPDDQLGFVSYQTFSSVDPFMYCADIPFTSRGEDGHFVIDMDHERAVTLTEKVVNLFNMPGAYTVDSTPFIAGNALFCDGSMRGARDFRDMEDDFGFLPSPKLDEEQEFYRDSVGDCNLFSVVPVTTLHADMAGAVLEALNAQTYRTVTPAWYEVTLKCKYARDLLSSDIIDLIHDSIYTNFMFAYSPMISQIGQIMRDLVTENDMNYASKVASKLKPAQALLNKMYRELEKNQ